MTIELLISRKMSEIGQIPYKIAIGDAMAGRKEEFSYLENLYGQQGNQLAILYGRRENGINELIKEFCRNKESFYFYASETSAKAQKQRMRQELEQQCGISVQEEHYDSFFSHMESIENRKLVIVVDEFERIVKKDEEFVKGIWKLKEKKLTQASVLILLYSSSISWVEQEMAQELGSFLKHVSGVTKLKELNFVEVVRSFPLYSVSQCVEVYGVTGGVADYLRRWDATVDIRSNICRHILSQEGFLYREAERIISAQLRERSVYNTILEAMASGKRKLNDLYQETGFSRAKISVYLKNLMAFDIVEKAASFETGGWENAQKGLYQIKDTFINFWFKFVYPNLSQMHKRSPEEFYDTYIAKELEEYLNRYFIKVCSEYLKLMNYMKKLPVKLHKMGTWIGKKGHIDIIVQNSVRENLICLCNWSEPEMTYEMCRQMFESMEQAKISANYYYLFSAKSFDEKLVKMVSEDKRIQLVDMKQL